MFEPMRTGLWTLLTCMLTLSITTAVAEAQSATEVVQIPVAFVSTITSIDAAGRVQSFKNAMGREFAVNYDSNGRIAMVSSVTGPNVADIVAVGYDSHGLIQGFRLRNGYALFYSYLTDGTQTIRDRAGAHVLRRAPSSYLLGEATPDNARLRAVLEAFDSLMAVVPL